MWTDNYCCKNHTPLYIWIFKEARPHTEKLCLNERGSQKLEKLKFPMVFLDVLKGDFILFYIN